ncbi:MAG: TRAP transporter small permease [Betaproteobacteria bacterium]|nr:TRAP transporter small permease [Betaproteobacteria bacterium]MDH4326523.1 TRAP transporter small permease [Betaproteobacteria bacterium]MDH5210612.1 TRAP transporter small permease [Betaproteobacteria bacterium]
MARGARAAWEPVRLLRRVIEVWALLGGLVLAGIALMSTWSAASAWLFGKPLPGDFEMVEMLVAVSVFMFLPYCQITGANVTADLFTARAGPRTVALLEWLAAGVALGFSLLLLWRMYYGLLDYRQYVETTTILRVPIWYAYPPALASLALVAAAALVSMRDAFGAWRRGA